MTKHYNPSIVERANRILASKAGDYLSDEVAGPVAVIPLNPVVRIVRAGGSSATGTLTLYTTPSDKDFYLTTAILSMIKDVTCDATGGINLNAVIDGVTKEIIVYGILTLTAQADTIVCNCPVPIKIDRNTAITVSGTYTAGTMRRSATVHGYTEEVTR